MRQLTCRIGDVPAELQSAVQSLPLARLESLGEALLDFSDRTDLVAWLDANRTS